MIIEGSGGVEAGGSVVVGQVVVQVLDRVECQVVGRWYCISW